jgi:lantibiotic transport system ATP-binding protein
MYSVETHNLTHRFSGNETVVDNINLQVPAKSIYGFLGPNGAGKTTTLKLILGLLKKQQGSISVFGKPFDTDRTGILKKLGSLIEVPSLYGHLTAVENLMVLQRIYQCPKERIPDVLKIVNLENTGKKKAGQFSLGMKQRLSIAASMLHDPALLILDEPTNGLDPNGIIEVRELLKRINAEKGITILISSHLLGEIEKLVSHVGIINKGKLLFQGSLTELHDKQKQSSQTVFETSDMDKAVGILNAANIASEIRYGKIYIPVMNKEKIAFLNRELVKNNIEVYEINSVKNDLETVFMDMTNN